MSKKPDLMEAIFDACYLIRLLFGISFIESNKAKNLVQIVTVFKIMQV